MAKNIKLNKSKLFKAIQSRAFLDVLLETSSGLFMQFAAPFAKNVLAPLATLAFCNNLGSVIDGVIQKIICQIDIVKAGEEKL